MNRPLSQGDVQMADKEHDKRLSLTSPQGTANANHKEM